MVQTPMQGAAQALSEPLTLEQFLELPETKPASEYIDGEVIQKPMPQGKHSLLQRELPFSLTAGLRPGRVAQAFPELRCTFGGRSVVPDVAVFRTKRIPRDADGAIANKFERCPDWTIEILSPEQRQTKVIRNILHCIEHGTEMGWLVEPEDSWIFVYGADRSVRVFEEADAVLPVPGFADEVRLTVGEVFDWLRD